MFYAQNEPEESEASRIEQSAWGWYIRQPLASGSSVSPPVCAHFGHTGEKQAVTVCHGCDLISFCRACRLMAHRRGHSVVGRIGFGRACVAARRQQGPMETDELTGTQVITFDKDGKELSRTAHLQPEDMP